MTDAFRDQSAERRQPMARRESDEDMTRVDALERATTDLRHQIEMMANDQKHHREFMDARFQLQEKSGNVHDVKLDGLGVQLTVMMKEVITLFSEPDKSPAGRQLDKKMTDVSASLDKRVTELVVTVDQIADWRAHIDGVIKFLWAFGVSGVGALIWTALKSFGVGTP